MKILEDRIIWDQEDFLAGLVPTAIQGETGTFRLNETGGVAVTNIDVFQIGPGLLAPGNNPSDVTNVSGTAPSSVLIDATLDLGGNNAYLLGENVHRMIVTSDTLSTTGSWPHTIDHAHANETGALGQIVFHRTRGTSSAVFYSFNDDTDGDVGVYYTASDQFHDGFMSSAAVTNGAVLTAGRAHPLLVTSDDLLLIGNVDKVHAYRQSTDTLSINVLNLPLGFEVVGFTEPEDGFDTWVFATTVRGSNRRGRARAFVWSIDRPASWYKAPWIPDDECAAPFSILGTVGCFTRSRSTAQPGFGGKPSVLRLYEDGVWVPKFYWDGGLPVVGGVEVQDNVVKWNSDGKLYFWGPYLGKYPEASHQFTSGSETTSGFLKSLSNGTSSSMYTSSGAGTGGLQRFTQFNTGSWQGASAAPKFPFGKKGKVTGVAIHLMGGSTGGGRALRLRLVDETFTTYTVFSGLTSFTSTEALRKYHPESFTDRLVEFSAIAPLINFDTGSGAGNTTAIERIEVYYKAVDIRKT